MPNAAMAIKQEDLVKFKRQWADADEKKLSFPACEDKDRGRVRGQREGTGIFLIPANIVRVDRIVEVIPTPCCSFCDDEVEDTCELCRKPFCWNHGQNGGGFKYGIEGAPAMCAECCPELAR